MKIPAQLIKLKKSILEINEEQKHLLSKGKKLNILTKEQNLSLITLFLSSINIQNAKVKKHNELVQLLESITQKRIQNKETLKEIKQEYSKQLKVFVFTLIPNEIENIHKDMLLCFVGNTIKASVQTGRNIYPTVTRKVKGVLFNSIVTCKAEVTDWGNMHGITGFKGTISPLGIISLTSSIKNKIVELINVEDIPIEFKGKINQNGEISLYPSRYITTLGKGAYIEKITFHPFETKLQASNYKQLQIKLHSLYRSYDEKIEIYALK